MSGSDAIETRARMWANFIVPYTVTVDLAAPPWRASFMRKLTAAIARTDPKGPADARTR